jgi:hypothetical protein
MATAIPDIAAALKLRIASFAAVTSIVPSTGILLNWPKQADGTLAFKVPDPTSGKFPYKILIQTGRGGPGELPAARMGERIDVFCYGPDERTANLLWRTVHYALCPPMGSSRTNGFTLAGCQVNTLQMEAGPNRGFDADTGWPFCQASYLADYKAF